MFLEDFTQKSELSSVFSCPTSEVILMPMRDAFWVEPGGDTFDAVCPDQE